ncbi:VOC family protein [Pedobacter cryoconitis]|uniref:PhnB protein n=1 Tax=Pedobacter cryoconitis TaxID=188932 RepID=A0A7X0J4R2_9SPHI|nr:VOC family protein [Pedobacter cryoconitis]MBB6501040.1 PhnB protein [Pedobacter cryoconitis]
MAALNPYLNFDGNTEEAFNFYKSVFGTEFLVVSRFNEMPPEFLQSPEDANKIMHISLPIGGKSVLMGSDRSSAFGPMTKGDDCYIAIQADSEEEATKLFNGLSKGGVVTMPLEKTFWNAYFGMFNDKFGKQWMINFDYNQN